MMHRSRSWMWIPWPLAAALGLARCTSTPAERAGATPQQVAHPVPPPAGTPAPGRDTPEPMQGRGMMRPGWARPDRLRGRVDPAEEIAIQVHLRLNDETGAEAELAAISDPDNPRYGQFLSDAAFEARYAPTAADVAVVRAHLEQNGVRVTEVPENRAYVAAVGAAIDVERAFGTQLGIYEVHGKRRRAPVLHPAVPPAVNARVLAVLGLSSAVEMRPHWVRLGGIQRDVEENASGTPPPPCSEWFGAARDPSDPSYLPGHAPLPMAPCGYRPAQLRAAYGFAEVVRRGIDGTGVRVAIVDAGRSPTLLADAQTYAAQNDPDYPLDPGQLESLQGPGVVRDPNRGWYGEQTLDVESVHAMAPGAHIVYVGAASANDQDLVAAINMILTRRLASIVSNSYGSPEGQASDFVIWHALAVQAGLKGVGLYFASGDDGDEKGQLGFPSVDFPASLDDATAVGGTSLALDRTGRRLWEVGWETGESVLAPLLPDAGTRADAATRAAASDGGVGEGADAGGSGPIAWQPSAPGAFVYGAGGGTSMVFEQPAWQVGVVPTSLAALPGANARVVPDVAMLADPTTGFLIGRTNRKGVYVEGVIGGTSLACPLFAGTMALAQQRAGHPFGFANPALYRALARKAFRDITPDRTAEPVAARPGVVRTFDLDTQTIRSARGYDNVTGLGVPDGTRFLDGLR